MRVVIALGGNALLQRGEAMTARNQRSNISRAAQAIAEVITEGHQVVVTHGNGPQVGLLALQGDAYRAESVFPLDVLGAETEGMIGYVLEQELANHAREPIELATLLTQIEIDPHDPAFAEPSKPVGPVYEKNQAHDLAAARGWTIRPDGKGWRRVVASPKPLRILEIEVIRRLVEQNVVVICAGGGGIPVARRPDGFMVGVEAVIDKDRASALLAIELKADALLMLTDVDAVYLGWGTCEAQPIRKMSAPEIRQLAFAEGSMAPKVAAACEFAEATGGTAGIGNLADALALLLGDTGTTITA